MSFSFPATENLWRSLPSVKLLLQSKLAAFLTNLSFFFFNLFFITYRKLLAQSSFPLNVVGNLRLQIYGKQ